MSDVAPKKKRRASRFDADRSRIMREVCERLSKGEPLTHICRADDFPCDDTIRDWAEEDAAFGRDIARAREAGFDAIALDCLHIADDNGKDTRIIEGESGPREAPDHEWISRAKLRVDTRLKLLAKWDPKRYGDKVALTGGGEGDAPIKHVFSWQNEE